jgi:hypothetical protein
MRRKTQHEQDEYDLKVHRAGEVLAQKVRDLMKATRCKFKCESVTTMEHTKNVMLLPVTTGSEENKSFFKYTPGGKLDLQIVNKDVQFEPGAEYYVDITKVE